MMPSWVAASAALTSGTTSGTPGSMRHRDELSMTTAPAAAAAGARVPETLAPAEKRAMSTPSNDSGRASSTVRRWPEMTSVVPAERADASGRSVANGKARSMRTWSIVAAHGARGADDGDGQGSG